jgi:transposase-like protein
MKGATLKMANNNIRLMARGAGVPFWRIAQVLGISEPTMTRKLRNELSAKEKAKIRKIIKELKKEE